MKRWLIGIGMVSLMSCAAPGQGIFLWCNASAPTRVGTSDGPLAGAGIWGQMLAGATPSSLEPVDMAFQHNSLGLICGSRFITVPSVPCPGTAWVQMVAWDARLWGRSLANVPLDQLGRTDIVPRSLSGCSPDPIFSPRFTQPAIVPIPEPSASALALLGAAVGVWQHRRNKKKQRLK